MMLFPMIFSESWIMAILRLGVDRLPRKFFSSSSRRVIPRGLEVSEDQEGHAQIQHQSTSQLRQLRQAVADCSSCS